MIVDSIERLLSCVSGSRWEKVNALLRTFSAETPEGEYPIEGEAAYARVLVYDTVAAETVRPEAHERYIDLQMTLRGCEGIEIFHAPLPIAEAYDPAHDIIFYDAVGIRPVASLFNRPGTFAILYPQDIHRPKVRVAGADSGVKKVVVKVRIN